MGSVKTFSTHLLIICLIAVHHRVSVRGASDILTALLPNESAQEDSFSEISFSAPERRSRSSIFQGTGIFSRPSMNVSRIDIAKDAYIKLQKPIDDDNYFTTSRPSEPTRRPTARPTEPPTFKPTRTPTEFPTARPTADPTERPTRRPTRLPTAKPTRQPTEFPSMKPTREPSDFPTKRPTRVPTEHPTRSYRPTYSLAPSFSPTIATSDPTAIPISISPSSLMPVLGSSAYNLVESTTFDEAANSLNNVTNIVYTVLIFLPGLFCCFYVWYARTKFFKQAYLEQISNAAIVVAVLSAWIHFCNTVTLMNTIHMIDASMPIVSSGGAIIILPLAGYFTNLFVAIFIISKIQASAETSSSDGGDFCLAPYLVKFRSTSPDAIHNNGLFYVVYLLMTMDVSAVVLLPWLRTAFTSKSSGYPRFSLTRLCTCVSLWQSVSSCLCSLIIYDVLSKYGAKTGMIATLLLSIIILLFSIIKFCLLLIIETTKVSEGDDVQATIGSDGNSFPGGMGSKLMTESDREGGDSVVIIGSDVGSTTSSSRPGFETYMKKVPSKHKYTNKGAHFDPHTNEDSLYMQSSYNQQNRNARPMARREDDSISYYSDDINKPPTACCAIS